MLGQNISKAQVLDLLGRLASDDDYRIRFQHDPEGALTEMDFPTGGFVGKLADKSIFATVRQRMIDEVAGECLCMIVPGFRLDYGDQHRRRSAAIG